jgi:hypothetical protein
MFYAYTYILKEKKFDSLINRKDHLIFKGKSPLTTVSIFGSN